MGLKSLIAVFLVLLPTMTKTGDAQTSTELQDTDTTDLEITDIESIGTESTDEDGIEHRGNDESGETTSKEKSGEATSKEKSGETTSKEKSGETTSKEKSGEATSKEKSGETTSKEKSGESTSKEKSVETTSKEKSGETTDSDESDEKKAKSGEKKGSKEKSGEKKDSKEKGEDTTGSSETTDDKEKSGETTDSKEKSGETTDSKEKSGETTDSKEKSGETTGSKEKSSETTDSKEKSGETTDSKEKSGETTDSKEKSGETTDSKEKSGETTDSKEKSGETTDDGDDTLETKDSNEKSGEMTESGETKDSKEKSGETTEDGDNSDEDDDECDEEKDDKEDEKDSKEKKCKGKSKKKKEKDKKPNPEYDDVEHEAYYDGENDGNEESNAANGNEESNVAMANGHGMDVTCWSGKEQSDKEECVENAGHNAIFKCINVVGKLPQFKDSGQFGNIKKVLGSIGEAYEKHKNVTQICLQEVFDRCSYDSNFRIKMKSVSSVGVNMDIDFQEEFEMDKCNKKSVQKMLSDIQNCYKGDIKHAKNSGQDSVCQILNEAAYCIEDHTAYPCVIEDPKMFKDTMNKLMHAIKEFSLKQLEKDDGHGKKGQGGNEEQSAVDENKNSKNKNETRLCLKKLDFFRVEKCEKDFFNFVQCLANGTIHKQLHEKVHKCFENAFKQCPKNSIEVLIEILAGAVGGRGGYQNEDLPELSGGRGKPEENAQNVPAQSANSECTNKVIHDLAEKNRKCVQEAEKKNTEKDPKKKYLTCLGNVGKCVDTNRNSIKCKVHKYSQFEKAFEDTFKLRDNYCKYSGCQPADFKEMEPCVRLFFQAYVNLHHIHYNKQSTEKQLKRASLCFRDKMKQCEKKLVDQLAKMHGKPFGLEVPEAAEGEINTRVTFPNENVVCSTRFWPLPTSVYSQKRTPQIDYHKPSRPPYHQRRYPTTKSYTHYPKKPERFQAQITPPATKRDDHRPPARRYTAVRHPTPAIIKRFNITVNVHYVTMKPVKPTKFSRKPGGGRRYTHHIKPTQVREHEVPMRPQEHTKQMGVSPTVTGFNFPGPVRYQARVTPTKAHFVRHTPPTEPIYDDYDAPATEVEAHRPQDKKEYHYHVHLKEPSFHKVQPEEKSFLTQHGVGPTRRHHISAQPKVYNLRATPHPREKFQQPVPAQHIYINLPAEPTQKVRHQPKRPLANQESKKATTHREKKYTIYIHIYGKEKPLSTAKYRIHHMPTKSLMRDEALQGTKKAKHVPKGKQYDQNIKGTTSKSHEIPLPTQHIKDSVPAHPTDKSHYPPGKGKIVVHIVESMGGTTVKYIQHVIVEHHQRTKHQPKKPQKVHHPVKDTGYTEIQQVQKPGRRVYKPAERPAIQESLKRTTGHIFFHRPEEKQEEKQLDVIPTRKTYVHPVPKRPLAEHKEATKVYTHHVPLNTRHDDKQSPQATTKVYTSKPKCERYFGPFPVTGKKLNIKKIIELAKGQCKHPTMLECWSDSKDKKNDRVKCDIHHGFQCEGKCQNYKVKLMCCNEEFVEEKPKVYHNKPLDKCFPMNQIAKDVGKCNFPIKVSCKLMNSSNHDLSVSCDMTKGVTCTSKGKHKGHGTKCSFCVTVTCCQCENTRHEHIEPPSVAHENYPPPVMKEHRTLAPPRTIIIHLPPERPGHVTQHWKPTRAPEEAHITPPRQIIHDEKPVTSLKIIIIIPDVGKVTGKEVMPTTSVYKQTPHRTPHHYYDSKKPTTMRNVRLHQPPTIYKEEREVPPTKIYRQRPNCTGRNCRNYHQRRKGTTAGIADVQPPIIRITEMYPAPPTTKYKQTPADKHRHDKYTRKPTHGDVNVRPPVRQQTGRQPAPPTKVYHQPPRRRPIQYQDEKKPTTHKDIYRPIKHQTYDREIPVPVTIFRVHKPTRGRYHHHYKRTTRTENIDMPTRHDYFKEPKITPKVVHQPQKPYIYYIRHRGRTTVVYFKIPFSRGWITRDMPGTTRKIYHGRVPTRHTRREEAAPPTEKVKHTPAACEHYTKWCPISGNREPMNKILQNCGKCQYLTILECRDCKSKKDSKHSSDRIACNVKDGFMCEGKCKEKYEARIMCCNPKYVSESQPLTLSVSIGTTATISRIVKEAKSCVYPIKLSCELVKTEGVKKNDVTFTCDVQKGVTCTWTKKPNEKSEKCKCTLKVKVQCCQCGHFEHKPAHTTKSVSVPVKPRDEVYEEIPAVTRIVHHRRPVKPAYHDKVKPEKPEIETYTVKRIHYKKVVGNQPTKVYRQPPPKKPDRGDYVPPTKSRAIIIHIHEGQFTDHVPRRLTTHRTFWNRPKVTDVGGEVPVNTGKFHQTPRHRPPYGDRRHPTKVVIVPGHHRTRLVTHRRHVPPTRRIVHPPTRRHYHHRKHPTTHEDIDVPITPRHHHQRKHHTPEESRHRPNRPKDEGHQEHVDRTTARYFKRTPAVGHHTDHRHGRPTGIHRGPMHTRIITDDRGDHGTTRIIAHTRKPGNYCDKWKKKPPKKSTITCYKVKKPKEICTSELLNKWQAKIRACVNDRMKRRGNCLEKKPITKECLKCLRSTMIICLRIVGDTTCRKKLNLLEVVMEKDIVIVGRVMDDAPGKGKGGSTPRGPGKGPGRRPRPPQSEANPNSNSEKCVEKGDSGKINNCYPGLYDTLVAVIVKKKGSSQLELHNINDTCLSKALQHCNKRSLRDMRQKMEGMFGVCVIPVPGQPCKSDSMGFKSLDSPYCGQSQIHKFTQNLEACASQSFEPTEFKQLPITKKLGAINECLNLRTLDCVFAKWDTFIEILSFICHVVRQTPKDQQCAQAFTISNFKECSENLISVTSALHDIKHGIDHNVMKSIKGCYKHSLKDCSSEVSEAFLTLLETLTNTAYLTDSDDESSVETEDELSLGRGKRRVTLSSIKVATDGVKICEQTHEDDSEELDSDTPAKDICEPLRSFENDDSKSTTYVLRKSCRGHDIVTWIESLNKCVEEICDDIAMEDPDSLTLERVLGVFRDCLKELGHLKCRPKVQKTFKLFLTSVLNTLRHMSVKSSAKSCHDDLAIDNIATCVNHLHLFLVVKYHASVLRNEESKSLVCLRNTCNHCDSEFLKGVLTTLDEAINKNKESVDDSNSEYTVCEPDDPEYNRMADLCQGIEREMKPSEIGPYYNILKKSLDTEHGDSTEKDSGQMYDQVEDVVYENQEDSDSDYQPTVAYKPLYKDYEAGTHNQECNLHQYTKYLETIFECQHLRMETLIYSKGTNCDLNWTEKSFESLVECLLENRDNKLPCNINSQRQVEDYLNDLSSKLNVNRKFKGLECPSVEPCFEADAPVLSQCSNPIFNVIKSSVLKMTSIDTRQTSTIFNCLKTIWPDCPSRVSLLSLPSIFVPFGINLNSIIKETQEEVCLSAKISSKGRNSMCSNDDKELSTQSIYECLSRITRRITEIMHKKEEKLPWQIIPFTVCVTTHPILECKLKDYDEFMAFMHNFLGQIQLRLEGFVQLFHDPTDRELGEKCLARFSAPKLDNCLSLMFGFMQSFHNGNAKASDYPSSCVEEIFGVCGDIHSFHLFMKKSMNISSSETESIRKRETEEEVCIKTQQEDYALHPCTFENFEKSLPGLAECSLEEIGNNNINQQHILEQCKNCVLKNAEKMCFYSLTDLKQAVDTSLSSISECLKTYDYKDPCIPDVAYEVKNKCLSDFHSYTKNVRDGAVMKAVRQSREFYHCIEAAARKCSSDVSKAIFNLYSTISGIEIFSKHKKSHFLSDVPG